MDRPGVCDRFLDRPGVCDRSAGWDVENTQVISPTVLFKLIDAEFRFYACLVVMGGEPEAYGFLNGRRQTTDVQVR